MRTIWEYAFDNDVEQVEALILNRRDWLNAKFVEKERPIIAPVLMEILYGAKKAVAIAGLTTVAGFSALALATGAGAPATAMGAGIIAGGASAPSGLLNVWDLEMADLRFWRENWTPLHFAAAGGATDVACELIAMGADTEAKDCYGRTFLQMADEFITVLNLSARSSRQEFVRACERSIRTRDRYLAERNDLYADLTEKQSQYALLQEQLAREKESKVAITQALLVEIRCQERIIAQQREGICRQGPFPAPEISASAAARPAAQARAQRVRFMPGPLQGNSASAAAANDDASAARLGAHS